MCSSDTEISLLKKQRDEARREAEAEKQTAQEFLSSVSHELRTPVAVLRGSLEALCDGVIDDSEQVKEYHRQMLAESIYLQRLVNDLLEFSRLQNSGFEISMSPVNVYDVISDICRSMRQIAQDKGVILERKYESGCYFINGDYARLRQMLIVILDNAIKFTDAGGKVSVSCFEKENQLLLCISDTGCGMPEENLGEIFTKFHRLVSDSNRSGTGLGLAIAKEIAQRHEVEITVKSKINEGSTFEFMFKNKLDINDFM